MHLKLYVKNDYTCKRKILKFGIKIRVNFEFMMFLKQSGGGMAAGEDV